MSDEKKSDKEPRTRFEKTLDSEDHRRLAENVIAELEKMRN